MCYIVLSPKGIFAQLFFSNVLKPKTGFHQLSRNVEVGQKYQI